MNLKLIAAGSAAALALAGTAAAGLQHDRGGNHRLLGAPPLVTVASTYIGVDKATLVADLKGGQSLAQVAAAHGKTANGLVAALLAAVKLKLDAAVVAGKLTSAQETTLVANLQTRLTNLVNRTRAAKTDERRARLGVHAILGPALSYLGLDLKAVVAQVQGGKTLAQVAVAQGKTAAGLVNAIVAGVKTKLDARVAAGKLTAAQETTFLAALQTNVTAFVNGSH